MKQIGSQRIETLDESGYKMIASWDDTVILQDKESGKQEMWQRNDDFAGYVIQIGDGKYEFVSDTSFLDYKK